jgi:hypothetical protein
MTKPKKPGVFDEQSGDLEKAKRDLSAKLQFPLYTAEGRRNLKERISRYRLAIRALRILDGAKIEKDSDGNFYLTYNDNLTLAYVLEKARKEKP